MTDSTEVPSKKASNIPKFTSFKPRTSSLPEHAPSAPPKKGESENRHESGHHRLRRDSHRRHHRHGELKTEVSVRHRGHDGNDGNIVSHHGGKEPDQATIDLEDGSIFFQDWLGDPDNVVYGKLHRYSVPRYRPSGRGHILGLGRQFRMNGVPEEGPRLVLSNMVNDTSRPRLQSLLSDIKREDSELIRAKPSGDTVTLLDPARNYVPLEGNGGRKRRRTKSPTLTDDLSLAISDPMTSEADTSESDRESGVAETANGAVNAATSDDPDKTTRLKLHELSQAIKSQPEDLDAWLALLDFHNVGIISQDRGMSSAERIAKADIKLSLYEQAISKITKPKDREVLLLGMLTEGTKLWDTRKLANQWQRIMHENSRSVRLWVKYLDFCQANALVFSYNHCHAIFLDAIRSARSSDDAEKDTLLVYIFYRTTRFVYDCGFTEHAWALWQAALEMVFLAPVSLTAESRLTSFAKFWESEVPRIGEPGAKGWKLWDSEEEPQMDPKVDDLGPSVREGELFSSWVETEEHRSKLCSLPARTLDDVSEDDPYRVILFSDIEELMTSLPLDRSKHGNLLIQAFLSFCDLAPYDEDTQGFRGDQFLMEPTDFTERSSSSYALDLFCGVADTASLFSTVPWTSVWSESAKEVLDVRLWKQRTLHLLVDALPDSELLAEYAVAYTFHHDAKEGRKYAKGLLKKRPSNLRLYNAYALVELRMDKAEVAERVWSTALSMSKQFSSQDQQLTILLWTTWIWECLNRRDTGKALKLLLSICDGQVELGATEEDDVSKDEQGMRILKTIRYLESHISHATTFNNALLPYYLTCLSLLKYLSNDFSLSSALSPYTPLHHKSARIAQSISHLIHHHATTHPHSPSYAISTSTLTTLLRNHPSNTILLNTHTLLTRHINLIDRLRSTATNLQPTPPTLITALHRIHLELHRPTYGGGTSNSIRSAFESALSSGPSSSDPPFPHSPLLWTLYLRFELSLLVDQNTNNSKNNNNNIDRALDVYHRGMRALPWHKGFAMMGFLEKTLRDRLGFEGCRRVWEGMEERGLRIRVGIEEEVERVRVRERRGH